MSLHFDFNFEVLNWDVIFWVCILLLTYFLLHKKFILHFDIFFNYFQVGFLLFLLSQLMQKYLFLVLFLLLLHLIFCKCFIFPSFIDQIIMSSFFRHNSLVNNNDFIRVLDCIESMCNNYSGSSLSNSIKGFLNSGFVFSIQRTSGFV